MTILGFLIPLALLMGMAGLVAFFWAMKSGQFEDLDGAANRILIDEEDGARAGQQGGDAR
ncbi:cbb3-type cytochrome oxidase assembly protein CcoS [Novosphingobium sp. YJ-S2-02]|uniref:Cbb3-type cytochrome oxidase assembly protein CcoS n=1 Tax=Novosphingobium aureum TaxID=2792964 RepID=A0A931HGX7_9SPHN|nr:cbb3-type cytochrome oxidase assembly protein CcoS [Novosphingobium aureum]MBH0115101.1 cbb3-type cytochrome oxidase assembly protein CcoS [Novosphingobium aureum]